MHVLATQALTLDEADVAIDLGQTPADVVVLSFSDSDLSALASAFHAHKASLPTLRLISLKQLTHPMSVDLSIESVLQHARVIVVRALGGLEYWRYGIERLSRLAAERGIALVVVPGCDKPDPMLKSFSTVDQEIVERVEQYFREGGPQNAFGVLAEACRLMGRDAEIVPLSSIGPAAVLSRDGAILDPAAFAERHESLGAVPIVFYRSQLLAGDTAPIAALIAALSARGLSAFGLAVTSLKDPLAAAAVEALLLRITPPVILDTTAFSSLREDGTTALDCAGVPVLQAVLAGARRDAWAASPRGLGATDLAMAVVLPELDGRVLTRAISFKSNRGLDPDLEIALFGHEPDFARVAYVAALAECWARLSSKPAREKSIGLVMSDYPARGGRAGYAVGLDTARSAASILASLAEAGYDVGAIAPDASAIEQLLRREGERVSISVACYRPWFDVLPEAFRNSVIAMWGEPETDAALDAGAFVFPVLRAGRVIVALQPDRGAKRDRKQGYHDIASAPAHAYIAFYAWLRHEVGLDALIHLGTHGTLEWLPGKAVALSEACAPEAVLGPMPVVYPFIVNNPGEAVQAKRRISAVTIGHLTPPLKDAGLHGALAELEGLIEEFAEADGVDRRRTALLEAEIVERAWRSGLAEDCGLVRGEAARDAITKLDAQLCDIKDLSVRENLHVFGAAPVADVARDLAASIAEQSGLPVAALDHLIARSGVSERASLVAALEGRRVAPGPAGAPTRGRADVLPTGRNLTTVDPRGLPTRTAALVGARAATGVIERYLQDHGDYPRALVVDLWASATLRTGGDDLAQALSYLGVKPVWDPASNRVTGVEVVPQAKLDRPRIDVTLRISGLFRDLFASQIALFEMAVGLVAALDEDDAWNPLAAARRSGQSLDRIFGAAPGVYGAGVSSLALDGAWQSQDDLGRAYLEGARFAYGALDRVTEAKDAFAARVASADALVHAQDDRERDSLDSPEVADYVGGFAAAAHLMGRAPALYHLDTSRTDQPRVRTIGEEITRIVRGRLTNPRWIAAMLDHGYRGASELAQGVDAMSAFQASARCVPGHLFDAVHDAMIANDEVADRLVAVNPAAAAAIAARLDDAIVRGLWTPRRNAVQMELSRLAAAAKPGASTLEAAQ